MKNKSILFSIIFLAFFLRLWGLKGNLPYIIQPDEDLIVVDALRMGSNHLRPPTLHYPSLYLYVTLFEYIIFFLSGRIFGIFQSTQDFAHYFFQNPTPFYLLSRLTTVCAGVGTVYIVYIINKKHISEVAGLWSGFFLAISQLHVFRSGFAGADVPMVFISTCAFYFILRLLIEPTAKNFILSGLFIGLSIGTKYNAGLLVLPLFVSYFLLKNKKFNLAHKTTLSRRWLYGIGFVGIGFFISTPFFLWDIKQSIRDISGPLFIYPRIGAVGMEGINGWWYYFSETLSNGAGWPVLLIVVSGFIYSCYKHSPYDILLLSLIIPYYIFVGKSHSIYNRFLLPVFPPLMLLGGRWLAVSIDKVLSPYNKIIIILILSLSVIPVKNAFMSSYTRGNKDLSLEAREWILNHIPGKRMIVMDTHGPPLPQSHKRLKELLSKTSEKHGKGMYINYLLDQKESGVYYHIYTWNPHRLYTYRLEDLYKYDYYILVSTDEDRFRHAPEKHKKTIEVYNTIREKMYLIKSFQRKKYQPGPEWINIFQRVK